MQLICSERGRETVVIWDSWYYCCAEVHQEISVVFVVSEPQPLPQLLYHPLDGHPRMSRLCRWQIVDLRLIDLAVWR